MSNYQIRIEGQSFNVSSDYTEEQIRKIESCFNSYLEKIPKQVVGFTQRLVLASLIITDELLSIQQTGSSSNDMNQIKSMCDMLAQACESTVLPTINHSK